MSDEIDDRFRSRKWRLALAAFVCGTVMLFGLVVLNVLEAGPVEWDPIGKQLEWWSWLVGAILALYGGANVLDKRSGGG